MLRPTWLHYNSKLSRREMYRILTEYKCKIAIFPVSESSGGPLSPLFLHFFPPDILFLPKRLATHFYRLGLRGSMGSGDHVLSGDAHSDPTFRILRDTRNKAALGAENAELAGDGHLEQTIWLSCFRSGEQDEELA
ncbi:hypothetical protein EVAR_65348_1 [Eumeta japonica]|uniref:Uncharacterized protein n=1 Tax=Eumeta variegata TaxID=151549 RepID=A0A4C1Z4C8_EUMVA|nr:hypothetical protein EVAR_65348_1 [Eumeta japonica]